MVIPLLFLVTILGINAGRILQSSPQSQASDSRKVETALDHTPRTDVPDGARAPGSITQPMTEGQQREDREDSLQRLTREYMIATIIGVLGAWLGVAILIWQTILSRRSSERQLRAYVVVELGRIVNVADPPAAVGLNVPTEARITHPGWGPVAFIQIKNAGQTPAFDVAHWGNICFREFPLGSALPEKPSGSPSCSILGPSIPSTKLFRFGPRLTPTEVTDLMAGKGAVYVYGEIIYEDGFRKKHRTQYRVMYHQIGGAIGVSTDLTFCDEGNTAD
jgi:hypothetical protein